MNTIFTEHTNTGDIVVKFPMATQVFKRYKIDFCCGGDRPIGEVIEEKQLKEENILKKMHDLYASTNSSQDTDWMVADYQELIDYVLTKHHAYLNQVLPEISGFVTKVNRVHGKNHPELTEVFSIFHELKAELEHHLIQEEENIFPQIKAYEREHSNTILSEVVETINILESEHESSGNLLKQLRKITDDYTLPKDACKTYQLTFLKLEELESDIFNHIHLENNILFPRLMKEKSLSDIQLKKVASLNNHGSVFYHNL